MWRIPNLVIPIVLFTSFAMAQPKADFDVNLQQGCAPIILTFQDLSIGAVAWEWDLGVSTSTLQHPGALYTQAGVYDIRLIVTDANGIQDTLVRSQYIEISAEPQAQFAATPTQACTFTPIQFSNQSTSVGSQITDYLWDFGDGSTSTAPNPTHVYATAGSYPVSLAIKTNFGCTDQVIYQQYITIQAPDPAFSADQVLACGPPLQVSFQAQTQGVQHQWLFGNGQTGTGNSPTQTYQQFGSFDVTHILTDIDGCSDTLPKTSFINIGVNTLSVYARDSSLCLGDTTYFFTNAASNSQVVWDFGNGDSAFTLNPAYVYPQAGSYVATAVISDQSGCSVTLTVPIDVYDYPTADFGVLDTTLGCEVPFTVQFRYTGTGAQSWNWNFGDRSTSTVANPTHIYTQPDSFRVQLTVYGPNNCRTRKRIRDYIKIAPTVVEIESNRTGGCVPLTVEFADSSTSAYPIVSWQWDFGDGGMSSLQHPTHIYQDTGYYDVRLITTNSRGCTDTLLIPRYISVGNIPVLDFAVDTNQACAFTDVQLINLSQGARKFIWYFDDGDTAMSSNPVHGFGALGPQNIILYGSDRGCADTVKKSGLLTILAPLPILAVSERTVCEVPRTVFFSNLSIGADRYHWDLDGVRYDSILTVSHQFTQVGTKYVKLTVSNDSTGCTLEVTDSVQVAPATASFTVDTMAGCAPLQVQFTNTSDNATKFRWHFTSRDSSDVANPKRTFRAVGDYYPRLAVRNKQGCKDTTTLGPIRSLGTQAQFRVLGDSVGCIPLTVSFEDLSGGTSPITQWRWDMGNGTTLTTPNPTFVFDSMAYYPIKLQVTDADGCTDSIRRGNTVYATEPIPDFRVTPPINCEGQNSTFVSLSTGAGLSYLWEFGDGDTATLANVGHAYLDTGYYDVRLTITDVNGCDSSITKRQAVNIRELQALFSVDTTYTTCPPLAVNFTADTTFPHQDITYTWDFGDGATSNDPIPTHIYTVPGLYTVSLVVSTPTGCADTLTFINLIEIEGPGASFSFTPGQGCPGTEIDFQAMVDSGINVSWVFGDGGTGFGATTSYSYYKPGVYTPILVAEDSGGCKVFHVGDSAVEIFEPPVAAFTVDDTTLCDSASVQFTDLSSSKSPILHRWWDFGTGDSSLLRHPPYAYNQLGTYDVQLILEDANGCRDTLTKPGYITVGPSPNPFIQADTLRGCVPFANLYTVLVPGHPYSLAQATWQDGFQPHPYHGLNSNITYPSSGAYTLSVTVIDQNGCIGDTSTTVEALALPSPDFEAQDTVGCAPQGIEFTYTGGASLLSLNWDFGDETSSAAINPTHTYLIDGFYTVSLTVIDTNSCRDSLTKPQYIDLQHPLAAFSTADTVVCPGETVVFTDNSTSSRVLTDWTWAFGQGDSSALASPSTQYLSPGKYTVYLTVEDTLGCADTHIIPHYIRVLEDVQPEPLDLIAVSVVDDQQVDIELIPYPNKRGDFESYQLWRQESTGNFAPIATGHDLNQTVFSDKTTLQSSGPVCYKVIVENHCATQGNMLDAPQHCTIDLTTAVDTEQVALSWTPYVGWDQVEAYAVFRVNDYSMQGATLIAELPGTLTAYTDYDMYCTDTYSYRVEAIGNRRQHSLSDTAFAAPPHRYPSTPGHILRATVENNAYVKVEWEVAHIEDAVKVVVERNDGNTFKPVLEQAANAHNTKYQDQSTRVHALPYTYRVFTVDTCGDYTPLGRVGTTIFLEASSPQGEVYLNWTPYEGWENGVATYQIETYRKDVGTFEQIGSVPGTQTTFVDRSPNQGDMESCYRIIAVEFTGNEMVSYSNEACVTFSSNLYTPNAFSPNGDGKNDEFAIQGIFVADYFIQIFDRWGTKVYEGQHIDQGWDGSTLKGSPAPEGVYVYTLTGTDLEGQPLEKTGSVTLIR